MLGVNGSTITTLLSCKQLVKNDSNALDAPMSYNTSAAVSRLSQW